MQSSLVQQAIEPFDKIFEIFCARHRRHYAPLTPILERIELLHNRLEALNGVKLLDQAVSDTAAAITRAGFHLITTNKLLCGHEAEFITGHLSDTKFILSEKDVDGVRTTPLITSISWVLVNKSYSYLDEVLRILTQIYILHAVYDGHELYNFDMVDSLLTDTPYEYSKQWYIDELTYYEDFTIVGSPPNWTRKRVLQSVPAVQDCEATLISLDAMLASHIRDYIKDMYEEDEDMVAELVGLKVEGVLIATVKFSPHSKYAVQKLEKMYNDLNFHGARPAPPSKSRNGRQKLCPLLNVDNVRTAMQRWPNPNAFSPSWIQNGKENSTHHLMNKEETRIAIVGGMQKQLGGCKDNSLDGGDEDEEEWDTVTVQDVD